MGIDVLNELYNKTLLNITFEDIIRGFEGQGHFKKV